MIRTAPRPLLQQRVLEQAARDAGAVIAARIDHGANAAQAGQTLRPTALLLLANPKAGTPLMQARQTFGISLPLKALRGRTSADRSG